ncbi:large conductance mechanosensitive channel protein MscL [Agromyces seonyuensis]|uniref:Large-conductance mechanosensitive channel n=1 Tax=Agromyces seonyuensis TaxID=2662446 RepID=A0A6I4NYG2_9MICO|nr:large conductance mechanosensitive channel protein MscL [Agromyces seonyuensis]MWB97485.1 large conductance mechanosensitive channel protein MscL [Agromyces seonyuensis]
MLKGFRDFIARGNVIDLAVAVVIGAAFTTIVNAIVSGIVNPLIALIFQAETLDQALVFQVPTLTGGETTFSFGLVIGAIINFLAVAVVVYFAFVMPMNKLKERQEAKARAAALAAGVVEPEVPLSETELLIQIRDLLAEQSSGASGTHGSHSA